MPMMITVLTQGYADWETALLNAVARQLNTRPRKTLGFRTPADMLNTIVASTA